MTVATLLAYSTLEASFRIIQMNLVLASLCAVLAKGEPEVSAAPSPAPR